MEEKEREELERAVSKVCSYCEEVCYECGVCPVYKIIMDWLGVEYDR